MAGFQVSINGRFWVSTEDRAQALRTSLARRPQSLDRDRKVAVLDELLRIYGQAS